MTVDPELLIHSDAGDLAFSVASRFVTALVDAQSTGAVAQVVLTGGRVAAAVYRAVAESPARVEVDWRRVEFWWGDERFLPSGDPERNETQARDAFLSALDVDPARVHPMPADTGQGAEAAAAAYAEELAAAGSPTFDVLMLGVGPDGHVASLFPGHPLLRESARTVAAVEDSPKPPPRRLTMTMPVLTAARLLVVAVLGAGKANVIAAALEDPASELPVARALRGAPTSLVLLDGEAAGALHPHHITSAPA